MDLESLANELLLDVFEYLPAVPLLRSFHRLNARLDNLIFIHFRTHRLDFRTASKHDFDSVCQANLPYLVSCVGSLGLSDGDGTPHQIDLFRLHDWRLHRFAHLHSLALDHIRSGEVISELLTECPHLIRLKLTACYFGRKQDDLLRIVNTIWTLPRLIHCQLDIDLKHGFTFPTPTHVSVSMEHLSNVGVPYRIAQLASLCEQTPRLRSLALDLCRQRDSEQLHTPLPSITELNLVFVSPQPGIIENLLQYVPNLCQLKIETCYLEMDGFEWEQVIRDYLPKLNKFQLKMRFQAIGEKYREEVLNSFRTRFWLEEHRWFVQYHTNLDDASNIVCLYTLPYHFSYLDLLFPVTFQSTAPHNDPHETIDAPFDYVHHLSYRSSLAEDAVVASLRFPSLIHLSVKLPVQHHLLMLIERMDRLRLLEVSRSNNISDSDAHSQLQALLNHAPHINALKFNSWRDTRSATEAASISTKSTPSLLQTRDIRSANLLGYDRWFNSDECTQLSGSSMGARCEVLFIKVKNQTNIIDLIHRMPHLQSLVVRSKDDTWTNYSSPTADLLVQWLQQTLPPTCSIQRDARFVHHIRIWIQL